jgi:hypothetical protein
MHDRAIPKREENRAKRKSGAGPPGRPAETTDLEQHIAPVNTDHAGQTTQQRRLARALAENGHELTGLDPQRNLVECATSRSAAKPLQFNLHDAASYQSPVHARLSHRTTYARSA